MRFGNTALRDIGLNDRLIAVSQAVQRWYIELGIPRAKVHVAYNGVDLQRYRRRPSTGYVHRQLGLAESVPLVGTIGQIGMRKGIDTFVEAAVRLVDTQSPAHFVGRRPTPFTESRSRRIRRCA